MSQTSQSARSSLVPDPERLGWMVLCLATALIYLPLNRIMDGGGTVEIPLDQDVPLWPVWVVPYLAALAWWVIAGLWAGLNMDIRQLRLFAVRWIIACLIGYAAFVFFPTYMVRPKIEGDDWATRWLAHIYANDRTYNAFPSMHLWLTTTISLNWSEWKPRWRWLWWSIVAVVALSTVFTGQHWILDPIGGILLALASHFVGPRVLARLTSGRAAATARNTTSPPISGGGGRPRTSAPHVRRKPGRATRSRLSPRRSGPTQASDG